MQTIDYGSAGRSIRQIIGHGSRSFLHDERGSATAEYAVATMASVVQIKRIRGRKQRVLGADDDLKWQGGPPTTRSRGIRDVVEVARAVVDTRKRPGRDDRGAP